MKKEITITLTSKEIEALEISVASQQSILRDQIDRLEQHYKTDFCAELVNKKRVLVEELEKLFHKLYEAEKRI